MDALVALNQTLFGQEVVNVLGLRNVQQDSAWLQALADDFRATLGGPTRLHRHPDWIFDSITVGFIAGGNISFSVNVQPTAGQLIGTAAGQGLPPTNSLLVSTQFLGAHPNRGRIYFAGMTEAAQDSGIWNAPVVNDFAGLVQSWVQGVGQGGAEAFLGIVGRPAANGGVYVSNPVDNVVARNIVATQRRRRIGQGS